MRSLAILGCLAALSGAASAQSASIEERKQKARELYEAGNAKYDLARYQEAIDLFSRSYETYSAPALLFNIAQSHRQLGNCGEAKFFYTRFLEKKPDAANRAEVEALIADLDTTCTPRAATPPQPQPEPQARPQPRPRREPRRVAPAPVGPEPPPARPALATADAPDAATIAAAPERAVDRGAIAARVAVGPSFPAFDDLTAAAGVGFALGAGYPVLDGGVAIDVGALLTYAPVLWGEAAPGTREGTVGLTALLANAGVDVPFTAALRGRAELGLGVLVMTGVTAPGNPFIAPDRMASGALSFFHTRLALGVEYALGRLALSVQPAVLSLSPAKQLSEAVGAIRRFEVLAGVAYRL